MPLRETAVIAALVLLGCGQVPAPGGLLVDEAGQPLAGWTLEATYHAPRRAGPPERVTARAETDASGRFPCFGVAVAGCVVACPPESDDRVRRPLEPHCVDLAAHGLRLRLARGTTISGIVVGDREQSSFMVHTVVHGHGRTERRCVPASPMFTLRDLDPDDVVDLRVERFGQDPIRLTGVVPGSDVRLVLAPEMESDAAAPPPRPASPAPSTAITGTVTDLDGRPIGLAWVRFGRGSGAVQTLTNFDGEFEERWTEDREYEVTVLVHRPGQPYDPGVPAGRVRGGARGVVLRVPR